MNSKQLAKLFHDTYERLAPQYGYETKKETRQFDENSPNGKLMVATCSEILNNLITQQSLSSSADATPKSCSNCLHYYDCLETEFECKDTQKEWEPA